MAIMLDLEKLIDWEVKLFKSIVFKDACELAEVAIDGNILVFTNGQFEIC
jgi:hypothetical protein